MVVSSFEVSDIFEVSGAKHSQNELARARIFGEATRIWSAQTFFVCRTLQLSQGFGSHLTRTTVYN